MIQTSFSNQTSLKLRDPPLQQIFRMGGPTRLPGSGRGASALKTQVYVSEDEGTLDEGTQSSGVIMSGGLTGEAFQGKLSGFLANR